MPHTVAQRPWLSPAAGPPGRLDLRCHQGPLPRCSPGRGRPAGGARTTGSTTSTCVNLNPATNVMNPRAEALLSAGLGSRPSLGYPGDKYEMGLEAIEQIEIIAAELAAEVFGAALRRGARRLGRAGQPVRVHGHLPARATRSSRRRPSIGGHVTHHARRRGRPVRAHDRRRPGRRRRLHGRRRRPAHARPARCGRS